MKIKYIAGDYIIEKKTGILGYVVLVTDESSGEEFNKYWCYLYDQDDTVTVQINCIDPKEIRSSVTRKEFSGTTLNVKVLSESKIRHATSEEINELRRSRLRKQIADCEDAISYSIKRIKKLNKKLKIII